jgi:hypothetical protein
MPQTYGSGSSSSAQNVHFNTPPAQVTSQINDGDEFILLKRSRQGDEPQVWSSGDQKQTQQMFRDVQTNVGSLETT